MHSNFDIKDVISQFIDLLKYNREELNCFVGGPAIYL